MPMLPMLLNLLGVRFQRRDKNNTGGDDAVGRALISMGVPVTLALSDNPDNGALIKALKASRAGLDAAIIELEREEETKRKAPAGGDS